MDIQILGDRIGKHFRHPVCCHLYEREIFSVGEMIKLPDSELKSIRNFGAVAMKKVNDIRELVKKANGSIDKSVNTEITT